MFYFPYLAIVSTIDRESRAVIVESIDIESIVESVSTSVDVVSQETVSIVTITIAAKINFFILCFGFIL
jgi:hypothetical protein